MAIRRSVTVAMAMSTIVLAAVGVYVSRGERPPGSVATPAPPPPAASTSTTAQASAGNFVNTRVVPTSLLNLEVSTFDLTTVIPTDSRRTGAIVALDEAHVLVVDADGRFFEVSESPDRTTVVTQLTTHLAINADLHRQALEKMKSPPNPFPVRVTDLHYAAASGELFVAYSFFHPNRDCITARVSSIPLEQLREGATDHSHQWRLRYETRGCLAVTPSEDIYSALEGGGRLWQTSPETLLLTIGDFSAAKENFDRLGVGRIVSINLSTGAARTVSVGHRNPQGLTTDGQGRLWATEHGPQGGDELNLIRWGRNYGWPDVSYGTDYGSKKLELSNQQGGHEGFEKPTLVWVPSIGVSNLIAIRGFHHAWKGDLLVSSLAGQAFHRLRLDADHVILDEPIDLGVRLRDLVETGGGTIYAWTDDASLLRVRAVDPNESISDRIAKLSPPVKNALLQCAVCHEFEEAGNTAAKISLFAIYTKHFGQGPEHLYSPALLAKRSEDIWWDDWQLNKFMESPESVVPGTSMKFGGIPDESVRKEVIAFLKALP